MNLIKYRFYNPRITESVFGQRLLQKFMKLFAKCKTYLQTKIHTVLRKKIFPDIFYVTINEMFRRNYV